MSKLFILLISLLCIGSVSATELEYNGNGFASYTWVGENSWNPDDHVVAYNVNAEYGNTSFKTQFATRPDQPIRRMSLEYIHYWFGDTVLMQVGRVARIPTLFSDVYGSPDEWGMSILPMSTYNRRKVTTTTFNALDGGKILWDHNYSHGNVRLMYDFGKAPAENREFMQMEATRKPYNPDWNFYTVNGEHSATMETTFDNLTFLYSNSILRWNTEVTNPTRVALGTVKAIPGLKYNFIRYGFKYSGNKYAVVTEYADSLLYNIRDDSLVSKARDSYITGFYYLNNSWHTFLGYSTGYKDGNTYTARDRFGGVGYRYNNWTGILEYHGGENSWQRYNSNDYVWRSWVASATYRF